MSQPHHDDRDRGTFTLPRIKVPPSDRPSPEELERRRIIIERIIERHERVGPIGIWADDLLHHAEAESES